MDADLTTVDFAIMGILLISGMIAWHRGFLKETLSVSAWLIAALVSVFIWPITKPFGRAMLPQIGVLADVVALVGVFFVVLVPVSFISFRLSEVVRGTRAGPLDKSLGFVFGLARGLLIVGVAYAIFSSLAPDEKQPQWLKEARLLPVVQGTADVLKSLGQKSTDKTAKSAKAEARPEPEKSADKPAPVTTKAADKPKTDRDTKPKPVPKSPRTEATSEGGGTSGEKDQRYADEDRRSLDQLVSSHNKP
jgi:membrane protein required for colicin V production